MTTSDDAATGPTAALPAGLGQSPIRLRARTILKQSSVLSACPDGVLDEIARVGSVKIYAKGDTVYRQGEPGDSLTVVIAGSLKVTNTTTEAKEVVLGFVRSGAIIGEIAVLDGRERTANVVALEATEALSVYRRDLLQILRGSTETLMALVEGMCGRMRATNQLIESLTLDTEARVAASLVRLAGEHGRTRGEQTTIALKMTQKDLGNYLGLTRETISRTLGDLRAAGLIEMRDGMIVVLDADGLAARSGA